MTIAEMDIYYWHILVVIAVGYCLWQLIWLFRPVSPALQDLRLNQVNFGMAFSGAILLFACVLHMAYAESKNGPRSLLLLCLVVWSLTLCRIAICSPIATWLICAACVIVATAPLLHYLFNIGDHNGLSR